MLSLIFLTKNIWWCVSWTIISLVIVSWYSFTITQGVLFFYLFVGGLFVLLTYVRIFGSVIKNSFFLSFLFFMFSENNYLIFYPEFNIISRFYRETIIFFCLFIILILISWILIMLPVKLHKFKL